MPDHLSRKSMKLFAEKVAPPLRDASASQFSKEFPEANIEQPAEVAH
jgi:hypothetical protein